MSNYIQQQADPRAQIELQRDALAQQGMAERVALMRKAQIARNTAVNKKAQDMRANPNRYKEGAKVSVDDQGNTTMNEDYQETMQLNAKSLSQKGGTNATSTPDYKTPVDQYNQQMDKEKQYVDDQTKVAKEEMEKTAKKPIPDEAVLKKMKELTEQDAKNKVIPEAYNPEADIATQRADILGTIVNKPGDANSSAPTDMQMPSELDPNNLNAPTTKPADPNAPLDVNMPGGNPKTTPGTRQSADNSDPNSLNDRASLDNIGKDTEGTPIEDDTLIGGGNKMMDQGPRYSDVGTAAERNQVLGDNSAAGGDSANDLAAGGKAKTKTATTKTDPNATITPTGTAGDLVKGISKQSVREGETVKAGESQTLNTSKQFNADGGAVNGQISPLITDTTTTKAHVEDENPYTYDALMRQADQADSDSLVATSQGIAVPNAWRERANYRKDFLDKYQEAKTKEGTQSKTTGGNIGFGVNGGKYGASEQFNSTSQSDFTRSRESAASSTNGLGGTDIKDQSSNIVTTTKGGKQIQGGEHLKRMVKGIGMVHDGQMPMSQSSFTELERILDDPARAKQNGIKRVWNTDKIKNHKGKDVPTGFKIYNKAGKLIADISTDYGDGTDEPIYNTTMNAFPDKFMQNIVTSSSQEKKVDAQDDAETNLLNNQHKANTQIPKGTKTKSKGS